MESELVTGTGGRYGRLLRSITPTPQHWRAVDPPRAAIAEAACYDGLVRIFDVEVVARAPGAVLVEQPDDGWGEVWFAWVPAGCVQPKP